MHAHSPSNGGGAQRQSLPLLKRNKAEAAPPGRLRSAPRIVPRIGGYTILRRDAAPDYTGDTPGAFLGYGRTLGAEQVALNVRVLAPHSSHAPPGTDPSWGHSHRTIEEIYFVLRGELRIKLGEDVETLGPWDAVRIPAATPRAVRNESDDEAAFVMVSVRTEDPRVESEPHEGFWPTD